MTRQKEIWSVIQYSNGEYEVSSNGRVRSWVRNDGEKRLRPVILDLCNSRGYCTIYLYLNELGHSKRLFVHRLVATEFRDNPRLLPIINHIDGDKSNNYFMNLEWCDYAHNNRHAILTGLNVPAKGERRKKSNLTESDVIEILHSKDSARNAAKKYNVNHTCIVDIRSGRSWNHVTGKLCTRTKRAKYSKDIIYV